MDLDAAAFLQAPEIHPCSPLHKCTPEQAPSADVASLGIPITVRVGHGVSLPGRPANNNELPPWMPPPPTCIWTRFGHEWYLGWVVEIISQSPPKVRVIYAHDDDDREICLILRHTWRLAVPAHAPYGLAARVLQQMLQPQQQAPLSQRAHVVQAAGDPAAVGGGQC
jgi:hypothetical protein